MGPAPANPTAHRDEHGGAQRNTRKGSWQIANSLAAPAAPCPPLGRWFGCPGAGPIRACQRLGGPKTVLMRQCQFAKPIGARAWAGERTPGPPALPKLFRTLELSSTERVGTRRPRAGGRRGSRSPAHARGRLPLTCGRYCVNAALGGLLDGQPRMGSAPANPTAHRDEYGGAQRNSRRGSWQISNSLAGPAIPSPLPGRWFGCPGAGTIRACHKVGGPKRR